MVYDWSAEWNCLLYGTHFSEAAEKLSTSEGVSGMVCERAQNTYAGIEGCLSKLVIEKTIYRGEMIGIESMKNGGHTK